jgi:hypothetical protein
MYTHHTNGLGEEPAAAEPSMWDSFSKLLTTGVSAGFNIYNRVQNLTAQQKATAQAQAQAKQLAQYSTMYGQPQVIGPNGLPMTNTYGQPQYGQPQSDFLGGWTMPLLLAGAAVIGVVLWKRK